MHSGDSADDTHERPTAGDGESVPQHDDGGNDTEPASSVAAPTVPLAGDAHAAQVVSAADDEPPQLSAVCSPHAEAVLRYRLAGWSDERIGSVIGLSAMTVHGLRKRERIDEIVDHYRAQRARDARVLLEHATTKALGKVADLMDSADERIAMEASKTALATAANGAAIQATMDASTSDAVRAVAAITRGAQRGIEQDAGAERASLVARAREARLRLMQGGERNKR